MSPSRHCSTATWIIQLSHGATLTVTALPAIRAPAYIGRSDGPSRPMRPGAAARGGGAAAGGGTVGPGRLGAADVAIPDVHRPVTPKAFMPVIVPPVAA